MLTTRYHRVRTLSIVLQDIRAVSSVLELDNEQRTDLQQITDSCRHILIDVKNAVDSDGEPGSSHGNLSKDLKQVRKRVIWEPEDILDLEERITSNNELLDAHFRRLASKDNVKSKDDYNKPPLVWAIDIENVDMVKLLLKAGANIKFKDRHNRTLLWWAAFQNNVDMVQLLLDTGADVNSKDNDGQAPLWCAALQNNVDIAMLLLKCGANVNSKNNGGHTPLWWAAWSGNIDMAKLLLESGEDVNWKDN